MKTKNMKTTKMTTMMMITAAALIGTIGIGAQSAYAETIDFETGAELDDVGSVVTATNTVTFKVDDSSNANLTLLPDGTLIAAGDPRYGFSGVNPDEVTGQVGTISLSNNLDDDTDSGTWNAHDYVILFDTPVENLRLDVYDFGDFGVAGSITLEVFSDSAATTSVGSDSVLDTNAGNDSIVTLSVPTPTDTILSARVIDTAGDIGTAIDNMEFDFYDLEKTFGDCDALAIQKNDEATLCSFIITYDGPEVTIEDTVPAEWNVSNPDDFAECTVESANKKPNGKSATKIICEDVTSLDVTYYLDSRLSPGKGHAKKGEIVYKPTFCGILEVNDGAIALNDNLEIVASTDPLLILATEDDTPEDNDCDLDGVSDADEFNSGCMDPANPDTDGDTFTDGQEVNTYGTDPCDSADQPTCNGINTVDICIDGDGIATSDRGAFSAIWGTTLTSWPAPGFQGPEGIDWFDTDASHSWTLGDDIHLERTASCTTGVSDGNHDVGFDCPVLDLDNSLFEGQQVDCDLETGSFCLAARLAELATTGIKFFDGENAAADTIYNNSEDIILDVNGDGIFN